MLATLLLTSLLTLPTTTTEDAAAVAQLPTYPMATCLVSGEPLDDDAIDKVHDGQLVRLCCKGCVKEFDKDPAAMASKVKKAVARAQMAHYPTKTCLMSGEPLDEDAIDVVHASRLVRVCCRMCQKEVTSNPAKIMSKLDAAYVAAQLPTYPLTTCPVSGEPIDDGAKNVLHGNRLVRLCCNGCKREFEKSPANVLAQLDRAAEAARKDGAHGDHERGDGEHAGRGEHGGRDGDGGEHGGRGDHDGRDHDGDRGDG